MFSPGCGAIANVAASLQPRRRTRNTQVAMSAERHAFTKPLAGSASGLSGSSLLGGPCEQPVMDANELVLCCGWRWAGGSIPSATNTNNDPRAEAPLQQSGCVPGAGGARGDLKSQASPSCPRPSSPAAATPARSVRGHRVWT